jgi:glycosyltransferase involved in cell wall biosynthesis
MPAAPTLAVDLRALVPEATGIGVYTRELLLALTSGTDQPFRYLGLAHQQPRGAVALTEAGIPIEVEPAPLGVLWQQLRLPRRLSRGDVDLFWSPLMTLPLRSTVPSVVTIHDLTALLLPETHSWKVRWSILPFLEKSLERARRIVAVSEATAHDLRFHFPSCAERVRVVYEGVDPAFRPGSPEEIAAIRNELDAPAGYLLYVGTLEPRKNLGALLDAWQLLRREDPETPPLVLAGGYGWRSQGLVRRIEALKPQGVRALGRVDAGRLIRLLQGASVFVYPSLYEGFGLPPLEAMACGVPTVVSNVSSLPEVVGDAGVTVDPLDPGEIAGAIQTLLQNPERAAKLAERGRERARGFTWEAAARRMEEIFAEALE